MTASITLATRDDDEAIRALLARNPVPGRIRVGYRREPDYFLGCDVMGDHYEVLVAKEEARVVGVACRAIRTMYVNGEPQPVGYLAQLRIDPAHRGRSFVGRGFRFLRQLHEDRRTAAYITTIIEGNDEATGVLVARRRPGMPQYRRVDAVHVLGLYATDAAVRSKLAVREARSEDADRITNFLRSAGPSRQFFPVVCNDDFGSPRMRGLDVTDFLLAEAGAEICGVVAVWDQSAYKQTVVDGYGPALARMRPLYNTFAAIVGRPRLPRPGARIRSMAASFFCTRDDDRDTTRALLGAASARAAARGSDYLLLALTGGDPRLAEGRRFPHVHYGADAYTVAWDDGKDFHDRLDGRPAYFDAALL